MSRPRTAQEFIHWLDAGEGARWLRRAALLALALVLSLRVGWTQFRGPQGEVTLAQTELGRRLAAGEGFATGVNYPQTAAVLRARGLAFDPAKAYPDLHHAPLYPLVVAAALACVPEATRARWFATPPVPPDGFAPDYLLLALNIVLLWLVVWRVFRLADRLFGGRIALLAAGGVLLSQPIWQAAVAVNGQPLLMLLAVLFAEAWLAVEVAAKAEQSKVRLLASSLGLGLVGGLLFLAEYPAIVLGLFAGVTAPFLVPRRLRLHVAAGIGSGLLLTAGPWLARNVALSGHPVALARHDLALKSGDPTAEPTNLRNTLAAESPRVDLRKLGNKLLASVQESLRARLWSGGGMWFTAFFVAGWLYAFRNPAANRMRWLCTAGLGLAIVVQAACNSGELERPAAVWMAPLVIVFGAGFVGVLLASSELVAGWPRAALALLLGLQALPLVHGALEPRRLHFQYPPYFPALFQGMRLELEKRGALGSYGLMADVPAGVAWYGGVRCWAQPPQMKDFHAISLEQPVGALLLSPRTLDRPFLSDLSARPSMGPGFLSSATNRFGEWGEIYGGLLTGAQPRGFPLSSAQKLADNLYVLLNPAMPAARGK
jgi:hypothetical protein